MSSRSGPPPPGSTRWSSPWTPRSGAPGCATSANGFTIPPQISLATIVNAIPRPWWWFDFLTTPKLEFASLTSTGGTVGALLDAAMDPTISLDDLTVIRELWPGKIAIKGVQTVQDATTLAGLGVDGIVLSSHGGRQLDRAPVPFHLLPDVVREVGKDVEIVIDTGIMHGADIVASIALGARFTLIGRATSTASWPAAGKALTGPSRSSPTRSPAP